MFLRRVLHVTSAVALVGVLAAGAAASVPTWDRATHFTFNAPVRVPGALLTPGTYTFELASPNGRNVVRVVDRNRAKVYTLAFVLPIERRAASNLEAAIVFGEAPATAPQPIKAWYPHGERAGFEFTY
jgi:hypothetical protein